jgi:hypothetical protein
MERPALYEGAKFPTSAMGRRSRSGFLAIKKADQGASAGCPYEIAAATIPLYGNYVRSGLVVTQSAPVQVRRGIGQWVPVV